MGGGGGRKGGVGFTEGGRYRRKGRVSRGNPGAIHLFEQHRNPGIGGMFTYGQQKKGRRVRCLGEEQLLIYLRAFGVRDF